MPQIPAAKAGDRVLEIVAFEKLPDGSEDIGHRSIVTGWSERQIDRLDSGMNINLHHAAYYTRDRVLTEDVPAGTEDGR